LQQRLQRAALVLLEGVFHGDQINTPRREVECLQDVQLAAFSVDRQVVHVVWRTVFAQKIVERNSANLRPLCATGARLGL
jgi:hypothetical protein